MQRGAATKGKVANQMVGTEAVEIKATIPNHQVRNALRLHGLDQNNDDERYIYFFDTPDLSLFSQGVVVRARRRIGDQHDTTVKLRPVDPSIVSEDWRRFAGFKIEADSSEKGIVKSASLTLPVQKGHIKDVAKGKKPATSLFTDDQKMFLLTLAEKKIDFTKIVLLGPIRASKWKVNSPALPWPITAELWRRGDGATILEVSIKVPVIQAAAAMAGFFALLAEDGAERDNAQQAKTRWALTHYADRLRNKGKARRKPQQISRPRRPSNRKRKAS
jgi:hypothetical protein